jgi:subtilisin family serine protease
MWIGRVCCAAVIAAMAAAVPMRGVAQRQGGASPVIVVLNDDIDFRAYERDFRADERMAGNPDAWGYQRREVVGAVQSLEARHGFRADRVYSHAIRGFAARLNARQMQDLRDDGLVAYIEPDGEMHAIAQTLPWGINKIGADLSSTLAGNGSGAVTGVNAYVIDTGIASHSDLNVVRHVNFAGGQNTDCQGHGTHVAGTVGARDNTSYVVGVAPGVRLTGVKVLGCSGSGSTSGVIAGVDWVTANAVKPAAANMSLGGGASTALDNAVRNSASRGVFYALAAGNSGANACNSSPARAGAGTNNGILTVAATDSLDREASWSNYGSCVDIWAPGVSILSTSRSGGTTTMSGTSMASPHGAGAGALYLSRNSAASPSSVESAIKSTSQSTGRTSKDGRAIRRLYVRTF